MGQNQKLYILVRNDMPLANQAVQACHAAEMWSAQWSKVSNHRKYGIGTTVLLSVPDELSLMIWERKALQKMLILISNFKEPDMGNKITAMACLTDTGVFDKLPMWPVQKENPVY